QTAMLMGVLRIRYPWRLVVGIPTAGDETDLSGSHAIAGCDSGVAVDAHLHVGPHVEGSRPQGRSVGATHGAHDALHLEHLAAFRSRWTTRECVENDRGLAVLGVQ